MITFCFACRLRATCKWYLYFRVHIYLFNLFIVSLSHLKIARQQTYIHPWSKKFTGNMLEQSSTKSMYTSLVPRPIELKRRNGLVHMCQIFHSGWSSFHSDPSKDARMCTVNRRVYDDIQFPQFCMHQVHQFIKSAQCVPDSFSSSIQRAWVRG